VPSDDVLHLDSKSFDELIKNSDKPVVVDFWAEWCPPCLYMAPIFEEVASRLSGKAVFAKVNVDECPDLAERYGIMAIPTIIVFVGGKPVDKRIGAMDAHALEELVGKYI